MMGIDNYYGFILAVLAFQIVPGPGTIAILNTTARFGIRSGMCAVLGTLTGDFLYMSAAVLGMASILNAYPLLMESAQWMGIAYLCWLGIRLLFFARDSEPAWIARESRNLVQYRKAFTVSITNPKVIMFFLALFPLFLESNAGSHALFFMMLHVTIISLLYQSLLVIAGKAVAERLAKWRIVRWIAARAAGAILLGFGLALADSKR